MLNCRCSIIACDFGHLILSALRIDVVAILPALLRSPKFLGTLCMQSISFRVAGISLVMLFVLIGCANWNTNAELSGVARLPQTRMSKNSVGVEIATITFDSSNTRLLDDILVDVDEQLIDPNQRRFLSRNGLIGGALGTQLPAPIQLLLMESADRREHPTAENQVDAADQQRFVQVRTGKQKQVPLWPAVGNLTLMHYDGELDVPELFDAATSLFSLRCKPTGGRSAIVSLTPQIQHGPLRQQYVAGDNSFHMAAAQETAEFADLEMKLPISSGETLLFTCNQRKGRIGQSLFRNATGTRQKILLVRLAQTQVDLSFEDE